jgi:hypothetical protein
MVRNNQRKETKSYRNVDSTGGTAGTFSREYGTGFGFQVKAGGARAYTPMSDPTGDNRVYRAAFFREYPLPGPKNKFLVTISPGKFELSLNDKRIQNSAYQLAEDGPFAIVVSGTWTIEAPQAAGQ